MPHSYVGSPPQSNLGAGTCNPPSITLRQCNPDTDDTIQINQFKNNYLNSGMKNRPDSNTSPGVNEKQSALQKEKSPAFRERQNIKNYKNVRLLRQQAQQDSGGKVGILNNRSPIGSQNRSPIDSLENSSSKMQELAEININKQSPSKVNMPSLNIASANDALSKL